MSEVIDIKANERTEEKVVIELNQAIYELGRLNMIDHMNKLIQADHEIKKGGCLRVIESLKVELDQMKPVKEEAK